MVLFFFYCTIMIGIASLYVLSEFPISPLGCRQRQGKEREREKVWEKEEEEGKEEWEKREKEEEGKGFDSR
jgi:hypothetical protein